MSNWNSSPHPISDIRDWSEAGRLELRPDFQRREVWALPAKIMLIDSIMRGVPLPKVFLANEIRQDRTFRRIIDGQQRISAILEFMRDEFALGPPYEGELAGMRFSDFTGATRDWFLAYKIDFAEASNADDREVRDVYMRVNKYTVPLNKQELRRADFPGHFLTTAEELSVDGALEDVGVFTPTDRRRYADAEYVSELLAALIAGEQDKKTALDEFYQRYATWADPDRIAVSDRFRSAILDAVKMFETWPMGIRSTRFRQKADFYSLVLAIDALRLAGGTIDGRDLDPLRSDLRLLDEHIAPTSDIPILSEYAIKCVSQANSQASRRWRTGFLEAFLTGTYLAGPPVDPALTAVLYQTRQQAGVDGAYRSEEAVDCEQCGSNQVTSSNEIVLGWPPESSVFQLANAQWLHLGCETEGWTILPRPAESGQVAGA